ncbi:MAG: ABC transporter permease [Eubacteriales bacterium]|nr:ABC transporter permease [Eubacteriales bacterium]
MRTFRFIWGEMQLIWKYGIVLLYIVFTLLYLFVLELLPQSAKSIAAIILVFTDPAAMGLFFMGAILLLEKGQRVHWALAVTPIKANEYILAKIVPLLCVALVAGAIISIAGNVANFSGCMLGIGIGSLLFSMASLWIATKTNSVNSFLIAVIPVEIGITLPALLSLFNVLHSDWWLIHPGVAAIRLMSTKSSGEWICLFSLLVWCAFFFLCCLRAVKRYFATMGGGKE